MGIASVILLAGLAAVLGGCGGAVGPAVGSRSGAAHVEEQEARPEAHEAAAPVVVEVAVAAARDLPEILEVTGTVEPWRRVSPGTKLLGRIDEVTVREGDRVRAGQVLARLERRDLEAAVEQARAAVAMAGAQLENAAAQQRRMARLHAERSVTDKGLEDAVAALRVAEAGLRVAEADLVAAGVNLSYAEIATPVAGWVARSMVERGDMAPPGAPLFVIEDLSRVKVRVDVPESAVVGLSPGDSAVVVVDVLGERLDATVDRVLPAGDRASRTFEVELVLDNGDGRLRSGMFVRARFGRGRRSALLVPEAALVRRGELDGLFVVGADGRARLRWVKLGGRFDEGREVLSGLEEGESYVIEPPPRLADGAAVSARAGSP